MLQVKKSLLVLSVLLLMACNAASQLANVTQIPISTQTPLAVVNTPLVETATIAPTATETITPLPSETATQAATIPPFLTSIPGIAATLTAGFSTPGAQGNPCSPADHGGCHRGGTDAGVFQYIVDSMSKSNRFPKAKLVGYSGDAASNCRTSGTNVDWLLLLFSGSGHD